MFPLFKNFIQKAPSLAVLASSLGASAYALRTPEISSQDLARLSTAVAMDDMLNDPMVADLAKTTQKKPGLTLNNR